MLDVLGEIIGAGVSEAATALSSLVGERVQLHTPEVVVVPAHEIEALVGGGVGSFRVFISQEFQGAITGKAVLVYTNDNALSVVRVFEQPGPTTTASLSEVARALLQEVGNVILGSSVFAIADVMAARLNLTVPSVKIETPAGYLSQTFRELEPQDRAALVPTTLTVGPLRVEGLLVLILGLADLEAVVRAAEERRSR